MISPERMEIEIRKQKSWLDKAEQKLREEQREDDEKQFNGFWYHFDVREKEIEDIEHEVISSELNKTQEQCRNIE